MSFDPAHDIPSLKGKVVFVTGANAGIGKATVRALAVHGPDAIYLCARRRSAAEAAAAEVKEETKYGGIVVLDLDLASLESVKKCAAEFTARETRLDLLFLNAGVAGTKPALTKEGYETQFGINHVGHALLTQLLMPTVLNTKRANPKADVRIIVTGSNIAFTPLLPKGGLVISAMREDAAFNPQALYAHSKLANALFVRKLADLYPSVSVTVIHPGVVKSDIWDKGSGSLRSLVMRYIMMLFWVDIDEGAKSQLWAATAKGVKTGSYYMPVGNRKDFKGPSADQAKVDELWTWTNDELAKHGGPGWPASV